ncbi:TetR/AcrR family transcriptional regulator [Nocardiopsis ansamitocini]|uniref:TetR family transcriptional regulator n=1 Tax=Nocardiopsis ansamitocini TaxID=1670832 RepID=A0A9W6PAK3_9ACTN|nr:TetR/AcrR family transcriptional regulator [Nocardiopsis ansamitocini]GLU50001.1 TetR family transcriptional regulator [Nocardiopsis ansamitocini]
MRTEHSRITDPTGEPPAGTPGLRADALHNRTRILETAREAFSTTGLDVSMAEIARRSGVGIATLYRRFPTKEALVTEAFSDQFAECVSVVDDALAHPDPWHGFCWVVEKVCAMQAVDRGFTMAFLSAFPDAAAFEKKRADAEHSFARLIQRAKDAGGLRADFAYEDLILLLLANGGVVTGSAAKAPEASRRLVAYLLEAFRADRAAPPADLPPAPSLDLEQVYCPPTA